MSDFGTVKSYKNESDLCLEDWNIQMLIDFEDSKDSRAARKHFSKLAVFQMISLQGIKKEAQKHPEYKEGEDFSERFLQVFCKNDSRPKGK